MAVEEARPEVASSVDCFIAPMGDAALRHCSILAGELRKAGLAVELAAEGKLKRMLEIANKIGARNVLIVGDNEIAAGNYGVKNMASGEQVTLSRTELVTKIKS